MDGCAVRAYITGLKADVLRAPDKLDINGRRWRAAAWRGVQINANYATM